MPQAETPKPAINAAPAPTASTSELVAFLREELTTARASDTAARAELTTLRTENTRLTTELTNVNTLMGSMTPVLRTMTQRLAIACGTTVAGLDSLQGQPLVDMFNTLHSDFEKKYPVGGKSRTSADVTPTTAAPETSARQSAAVKATKLPTSK